MCAIVLAALLVASPALGQGASGRQAITTLYKTVPELLAARVCGFRDRAWFDKQMSRIQAEAHAIADRSLADFDNDPSDANEFISGAQDQAVADGTAENNRFRQAACQALMDGGRLPVLDGLLK